MSELIMLREPRLVPVIELEHWNFSSSERPRPYESAIETPEAWGRYWLDCLSDSGIAGLSPLRPASWHVMVHEIGEQDTLTRLIRILAPEVGDISTPEGMEDAGALPGGLALLDRGEVLVEPTCCSDLGNLSEWREAAAYRETGWRILWIGHPWLSVRSEGRMLVLSEPHESEQPKARWVVDAAVLDRAVDAAEATMEGLARRLESVVEWLGSTDHTRPIARRLAGLAL